MTQRSVVLVGAHGHGASHLARIREREEAGRVRLVGICDPRPVEPSPDVTWDDDLARLLRRVQPDVVVLCTPIHTHAALATIVAEAGVPLLLEKPPTANLASYHDLLATVDRAGIACQVGFQDLGSHALPAVRELMGGSIGDVTGIGGAGRWVRPLSYFRRAPWAGRRRLDGQDVVDGALTNPFAHAVATALWLAGATATDDVADVATELFHVNDTEADDTSCVRITTRDGLPIVVAGTLAAEVDHDPVVIVHGTTGRLRLAYKRHELTVEDAQGARTHTFGATDPLDNLLDHLDDATVPLVAPLAATGGFMRVLEAVRCAPDPRPIAAAKTARGDAGPRRLLAGIDDVVLRCAEELATFSELGMPWALPPPASDRDRAPAVLHRLTVGGVEVGTYRSGSALDPTLAPRPHLHPLRTLRGTPVTDTQPDDHAWHLGLSVTLQDVDGVNFWGGRTYLRGPGYVWRHDHGRIDHEGWLEVGGNHVREALTWRGPGGSRCLLEERTLAWAPLPGRADAWVLHLRTTLTNPTDGPVSLGSPATNGRPGAGYGGIFWRFPTGTRAMEVRSPSATGEDAVHGQPAPWLACRSDAGSPTEPFTVVLAPTDTASAADPWFVRTTGYPGVGLAVAFEEPLVIRSGASTTRSLAAAVVDGHVADEHLAVIGREAADVATAATEPTHEEA